MEKVPVKLIIDFRRKSERSKRTLVNKLKLPQVNNEESDKPQGNYWSTSLSAIRNTYKTNKPQLIKDKIHQLEDLFQSAETKRKKNEYQCNIDVLYLYESFNFKTLKPINKLLYLTKPRDISILTIKGLPIHAQPCHVYTFENGDQKEISAIWFIAKKGGFTDDELGVFAEVLYRYLKANYSKDYIINTNYCIAVDVVHANSVSYKQIELGDIPKRLVNTIDEIAKYMA